MTRTYSLAPDCLQRRPLIDQHKEVSCRSPSLQRKKGRRIVLMRTHVPAFCLEGPYPSPYKASCICAEAPRKAYCPFFAAAAHADAFQSGDPNRALRLWFQLTVLLFAGRTQDASVTRAHQPRCPERATASLIPCRALGTPSSLRRSLSQRGCSIIGEATRSVAWSRSAPIGTKFQVCVT